ncbi:MAG TPA: LysM domain-containing protein [Nitrospiraceae bacterium]|jgi:hypothetical protein|nr:LysM domain-containing protein [Nitrospiraceae bacterium]
MSDPLQALLQTAGNLDVFPINSRYHGIEPAIFTTADGRPLVYVRRRFVPPSDRFALLQEHTIVQGDRLDSLAANYLGDPELFWRLCDANTAMRPEELTEIIGRILRITLPEGIPGTLHE